MTQTTTTTPPATRPLQWSFEGTEGCFWADNTAGIRYLAGGGLARLYVHPLLHDTALVEMDNELKRGLPEEWTHEVLLSLDEAKQWAQRHNDALAQHQR